MVYVAEIATKTNSFVFDDFSLLGRYRDYDPELGGFISKDPILFAGGDTNLYGYVMNDPINFIDPSGLSPEDVFRLQDAFNGSVEMMTSQGRRRPGSGTLNGTLNNMESFVAGMLMLTSGKDFGFNLYDGCQGQTNFTKSQLQNVKTDDNWSFNVKKQTLPMPHYNLEGRSSNPTDPVLIIDPWRGSFGSK